MRSIKLTVGRKQIGTAATWAYPHGEHYGVFVIPTYPLLLEGTSDDNKKSSRTFEVIRFGVKADKGQEPRIVGLADQQTHIIKAWLPHYSVHSAESREMGAWQVYDNFLIHDGPDDPKNEVYASIGCIEICGGPNGFDQFNDHIISLSGSTRTTRAARLADIGSSKKISITYEQALRPSLAKYKP